MGPDPARDFDPFATDSDAPGTPGRSKEADAEALQAAKEAKDRGFKVVPEDMQGGSAGDEPAGNR